MTKSKGQVKKGYEHIQVKHIFTDDEKRNIATSLANQTNELATIEDEKKTVTSSFKAKIDAKKASINQLSMNYANGYEYQMTKTRLMLDFDVKQRIYLDMQGNRIHQEPLHDSDYQTDMLDEDISDDTEERGYDTVTIEPVEEAVGDAVEVNDEPELTEEPEEEDSSNIEDGAEPSSELLDDIESPEEVDTDVF